MNLIYVKISISPHHFKSKITIHYSNLPFHKPFRKNPERFYFIMKKNAVIDFIKISIIKDWRRTKEDFFFLKKLFLQSLILSKSRKTQIILHQEHMLWLIKVLKIKLDKEKEFRIDFQSQYYLQIRWLLKKLVTKEIEQSKIIKRKICFSLF